MTLPVFGYAGTTLLDTNSKLFSTSVKTRAFGKQL
jgi:hypothetical protein